MTMLLKGCKPDNFECDNSLKLSFISIRGLHSNFVECESFLESNSPDILPLFEKNLTWLNWFWPFFYDGLSSFNLKGLLLICMVLQFMWKKDFLLQGTISKKLCRFLCFRLALLQSVLDFFFLHRSPSSLCSVFDSISCNIDEVFSINPSAVFVFGDINVRYKDC